MNPARILPLLTLAPLAFAQDAVAPQEPEPTFTLTPQEIAQGWHVLFDGTSTDAWRGYKQSTFPAKGWTIADGALQLTQGGGGGDIVTRRTYRNFELAFEWKISERGNSGVMYRVVETDHPSYWTGPEFQVLDAAASADGKHSAGALYALYAPKAKVALPAGEWNVARIVIVGDRVEHWLNGEKIIDATFGSDDWDARVKDSKFATWDGFAQHARGHLCLQDHGNAVWYRNIKCRELPPTEDRHGEEIALFDGSAASFEKNWSFFLNEPNASMADVWSVQDGVIVCKGKPTGYIYTNGTFDDFLLRVVWRFDPEKGAGNSGVLLRMTGENEVWPRSIEAQLQSGNAGDFWNIGNVPMEVDASRTRGRNTKKTHGNEKPIGEWNTYEIICDDGWVSLRVNGDVLNEAWNAEDVAGHICLQSEGAEIHFREVTLTKLKD